MVLTVHQPRAKDRAVRQAQIVNGRPRPVHRIRHREYITHRRGRAHVPEVLAGRMPLAASSELFILLLHDVRLGQERVDLGLVREVARRVDAAQFDRARPERVVFVVGIEAGNISRAKSEVSWCFHGQRWPRERSYLHGQGPDAAGVPAHDVVAAADLCTQQITRLIESLESGDTGAACGSVQLTSCDGGKWD